MPTHKKNQQLAATTTVVQSRDERTRPSNLPIRAGVGLKHRHYDEILQNLPDVGFFELHAENYLGGGGKPIHVLEKIREHYPISIHGVGLSIGSAQGLNETHLNRVAALVKRFEPAAFSEHLAWSTHGTTYHSDLLPVPYNRCVEDRICDNIDRVQNLLQRPMLLENPTNYLQFESSTLTESELLINVAKRTGCGLLLDVNNVYISAKNMGYSAKAFINSLPGNLIGELHLAGHSVDCTVPSDPLFIDAHDREVCEDVWSLYEFTLRHCGAQPTLIEWDNNVPAWSDLADEMTRADAQLLSLVESSTDLAHQ